MGMALYGWVSQSSKTVLNGASLPAETHLILAKTEGNSDEELEFLNGAHPRTKDGALAQSAATEGATPAAPSEEGSSESVSAKGEVSATANLQQWWGQQIPFKTIVGSGALAKKSDGTYGGAGGFTMGWDNCSNTPYLFNNAQRTVISYDGESLLSLLGN
jgi:chitinase